MNPNGPVDVDHQGWEEKETVTVERLRIDATSEMVAFKQAISHSRTTEKVATEIRRGGIRNASKTRVPNKQMRERPSRLRRSEPV